MALSSESKMNVAALKRVDPYVKDIVETAAHVALYRFNSDDNEWVKTEVEGALFVYSRTGEPFHNIIIMNRLNTNNFVEPVTPGLDLNVQDPFLLYRTTKGDIFCIWFYDKEECTRIATALNQLVKETLLQSNEKKIIKKLHSFGSGDISGITSTSGLNPLNKSIFPNQTGGSVDIFSMLTKAQEEYNNKTPNKQQSINENTAMTTKEDQSLNKKDGMFQQKQDSSGTPKSVMEFFAKASSGSQFINVNKDALMNNKSGINPTNVMGNILGINPSTINRTGLPPPGLSGTIPVHLNQIGQPISIISQQPQCNNQTGIVTTPNSHGDNKIIQRLMSNPAHTVEHIEKQQRSLTPQSELAALMRGTKISNNKEINKNIATTQPQKQGNLTSTVSNIVIDNKNSVKLQSKIENGLGFFRINDRTNMSPTINQSSPIQTQSFFNRNLNITSGNNTSMIKKQSTSPIVNLNKSNEQIMTNVSVIEQRSISAPFTANNNNTKVDTINKPALMPPTMFTSSTVTSNNTKNENITNKSTIQQHAVLSGVGVSSNMITSAGNNICNGVTSSTSNNNIEPLTKNQLLQALKYLLVNDAEFTHKLHEAYVKSVTTDKYIAVLPSKPSS